MKARPIEVKPPKPVARIVLCGAIGWTVTDQQNFIKPTPEQIANLRHLLNIDVELFEDEEAAVEEPVEENISESEVVS